MVKNASVSGYADWIDDFVAERERRTVLGDPLARRSMVPRSRPAGAFVVPVEQA